MIKEEILNKIHDIINNPKQLEAIINTGLNNAEIGLTLDGYYPMPKSTWMEFMGMDLKEFTYASQEVKAEMMYEEFQYDNSEIGWEARDLLLEAIGIKAGIDEENMSNKVISEIFNDLDENELDIIEHYTDSLDLNETYTIIKNVFDVEQTDDYTL